MKIERISEQTTNRLSVYLRCLNVMAQEGITTISSHTLAERFDLNSAQIRKDLAYFGEFGVRGVGYSVEELRDHLRQILGLTTPHRVAIIGAGNLGAALANYQGFSSSNFRVVALFDTEPSKIGQPIGPGAIPINPMSELAQVVQDEQIDMAVLAVPAAYGQAALDRVVGAGIRAVLNFAPTHLHARPGVKVRNVDLTSSLEGLSYFLAHAAPESE